MFASDPSVGFDDEKPGFRRGIGVVMMSWVGGVVSGVCVSSVVMATQAVISGASASDVFIILMGLPFHLMTWAISMYPALPILVAFHYFVPPGNPWSRCRLHLWQREVRFLLRNRQILDLAD